MLLEVFLSQAGIAFTRKLLNTDTLGSAQFSMGEAIGNFFGSLSSSMMGSIAHDQVSRLSRTLQTNGLPVNHDIQRAVRKAFLYASIETARFVNRNNLFESKQEKLATRHILDYLEEELKKLKDTHYNPEEDNPAVKCYGYLINRFTGLGSSVTATELQEQLHESVLRELEFRFFYKDVGEIPGCYANCIKHGWKRNAKDFSFFGYMSDYFHEFIKTDDRLKVNLQTEWLTQILAGTGELKSEITHIAEKFEEAFEKLGGQSIAITGKLNEIINLLKPQPKLKYDYHANSFHKTLYKRRYLDLFLGREEQLTQLMNFFDNKQQFSWWLVTGAGGIGKSRLALECCFELSYSHTVNMGFGSDTNSLFNFNWANWEPLSASFIIIDYASGHYEDLIRIFECLSNREDEFLFPVRFLLLEREAKGTWWDEIQKELGHRISRQPYAPPMELNALKQVDLWNIIEKVLQFYQKTIPAKGETLNALKEIDTKGRPLFAWFAAFALAEGENVRNWNVNNLLQSQLNREESRVYASLPGGKSEGNKNLLALHRNLMAITTMVNGLSSNELEQTLANGYAWLPGLENFSLEIHHLYAEVDDQLTYSYRPIEPDILGEYFVLQQLNAVTRHLFSNRNKAELMVRLAWEYDAKNMAVFVLRVFNDFYREPVKKILLLEPLPGSSLPYKIWWSLLAIDIIAKYGYENDIEEAVLIYEKSKLLAVRENIDSLWITLGYAASNLIYLFGIQDSTTANFYLDELKQLAQDHPSDDIWIRYSTALSGLIELSGEKNLSLALSLMEELKELALQYNLDAIRINVAVAMNNLIVCIGEKDLGLALSYFEALHDLANRHPLDEIWIQVAKAAFNVIAIFGGEDLPLALSYLQVLREITIAHPLVEIWNCLASAINNIINFLGNKNVTQSISYHEELKDIAGKHPVSEIILPLANATNNIIIHFSEENTPLAVSYYNAFKALVIEHPLNEMRIMVANVAINITSALLEKDLSRSVFYLEELKVFAAENPLDEIWKSLAYITYNLIDFLSEQTPTLAFPYLEELKVLANQHPLDEIVKIVAKAISKLIVELLKQDSGIVFSLLEQLKAWARDHPLTEIWTWLATALHNLMANLCDRDISLALPYYDELKELALNHASPGVSKQLAEANGFLVFCFGGQNPPLALSYLDELKKLAVISDTEEIWMSFAIYSYALIANYPDDQDNTYGLGFFKNEIHPMAARLNLPGIWMVVEMILVYFLEKPPLHNQEEHKELVMLFKKLLQEYRHHDSWQKNLPLFNQASEHL